MDLLSLKQAAGCHGVSQRAPHLGLLALPYLSEKV
jgi:hypothetical protein